MLYAAGRHLEKQPDNDIVRRSYEKAAYYAKETQDSCTLGDCYGHLVDHFRWENNYDMMYEYSRKAYDLYTKLGLKKMPMTNCYR